MGYSKEHVAGSHEELHVTGSMSGVKIRLQLSENRSGIRTAIGSMLPQTKTLALLDGIPSPAKQCVDLQSLLEHRS